MPRSIRIKKSIFTALLLFIAAAQSSFSQGFDPKTANYTWPTEASEYMSATFGETRAAHFHAALDIKTWGRRGYRVFATRDGILHRLAVSAYGYGKVVYLKHDDGSFSLYAHLDDFAPSLADSVDFWRLQSDTFEIDRNVETQKITVKAGDLVGYSGSTGIGPPHLHFELRTPTESPFNPLLTNLEIPDHVAPRLDEILVEPLSPNTRINGKSGLYRKKSAYNRGYTFGSLNIEGPFSLAIDAFDQADGVANVYAVYELILELEGDTLFHSRVDSFSYHHTSNMFVDRVYRVLQAEGAGFQRLWVADGNELPFYSKKNRGFWPSENRAYELTITAKDYAGNQTKASLSIRSKAIEARKHPTSSVQPQAGTLNELSRFWSGNWVMLEEGDQIRPFGSFQSDSAEAQTFNSFSGFQFFDADSSNVLRFHRSYPKHDQVLHSFDQRLEVHIPKDVLFDTCSVSIHHAIVDQWSTFSIIPEEIPLKGDFKVRLLLDEEQQFDDLRLYRLSPRKKTWKFVDSYVKDGLLYAEANDFGRFRVFRDTLAPSISRPRIFQNARGLWKIAVDAKDEGSGIDYSQMAFYCNGVKGVAEYEPDRNRIVYRHPGFSPRTENQIRLEIRDRSGNVTVFEALVQP